MVDLNPYCGTDIFLAYLHKPFSVGKFTYATNGHIMVRVPRRDDAPEQTKEANWEGPLKGIEGATFSPLAIGPLPVVPASTEHECSGCEGRGHEHECPDCDCVCEVCNGSGRELIEPKISTTIRGNTFQLKYALMMLALPGVVVADKTATMEPLVFKFDGGVGAVMPTRGKMIEHVEIEFPSKAA